MPLVNWLESAEQQTIIRVPVRLQSEPARNFSRRASFLGEFPKSRAYSRLNWDGLSYPTSDPIVATSLDSFISSIRAC
ncbi:hypothetical protein AWB69_09282 [Caballeronia udeis]|uniref:Uncharacterized protein n=1 Tax=Caballeronia udeis TaxID=1232866 RepID=A0A158K1W5_9BURK|nr:hypothetical protein AWB69_09282 [Caballeronia udeis]